MSARSRPPAARSPYRDVARERQPLVCGLHRGMTRGLLDEIEPKTKLSAFVPKDPDAAGCEITLRGPLANEARGGPLIAKEAQPPPRW